MAAIKICSVKIEQFAVANDLMSAPPAVPNGKTQTNKTIANFCATQIG